MQTTCTGNMKQLTLAMHMYASDNKDWLAFCNWDGGNNAYTGTGTPPTGYGPGWLYQGTCIGLDPGPGGQSNYIANPQQAWVNAKGVWWPYVGNYKSYQCPVGILSKYYRQRQNQLCSYVMDGAACGFANATTPGTPCSTKISQVWSPLCYLFWEPDENCVGPGNPGAFEFNDAANFPNVPPNGGEGVGPLHNKTGGNIARLDGGVQFINTNNFNKQSLMTGRSLLWWSTFSTDGHQ
jgi:hypothetical protein